MLPAAIRPTTLPLLLLLAMIRFVTIALAFLCLAPSIFASDTEPRFETHVRSIFKKHCFHCHGEEQQIEGSLDVRLVRLLEKGGDSGPAIEASNADDSLLFQRIRDGEMPPDESKQLTSEEMDVVRRWIDSGAKTVRPEPESIQPDAIFITEEERAHWAYQPIERSAPPVIKQANAVANPIDTFLLAKLEAEGFGLSPRASATTLIRRLYLDLHGLPPSPNDVAAFVAKSDSAAWSEMIDRLLESPNYGERWARHWLDAAGYSDSEGYNDADAERPSAWRFRDYVIRAFNSDKPFDQFIQEQLAGDEMVTSALTSLSAEDAELLTATGFLRMAPDGTGGSVSDANVARNDTIADTVKIVSSSLMGMTVGCAQCHDHRYDPISHEDYYRFRAIFEPAFDWQKWRKPAQRRISLYTDQDRATAADVEVEAKKIDADHLKKQTEFIDTAFEKTLAKLPAGIHEVARAAHQLAAKKRTSEQKALFKKHPTLDVTSRSLYLYDKKAADELKKLAGKATKLRAKKPKEEFVRALTEVPGRIPVTQLFYRGDHEQPKQELSPAGLTVVSQTAKLSDVPSNNSQLSTTGRRLAFAKRLTSPSHPLTARAIVNRVWLHHFGRGLVTTPADFGALGQKPSHPQLLDWLASEFIDSGWSLKHLHRLILTSNAWQQQLRDRSGLAQVDPDNDWYGGGRLIRLDAEVVRDCMLSISGKLNAKAFGPAVPVMADRVGRFVIGKENLNAGRPGPKVEMKGEEFRRSIYIQVRRSRPLSVLEAFDQPIMSPNCDMRRPSTSSTQSLMMMNSDLLLTYSEFVADRLGREAGSVSGSKSDTSQNLEAQIRLAWQLVYSRAPEHSEVQTALHFIKNQTEVFTGQSAYKPNKKNPPQRSASQEALASMCQMLLSSNEFLYVD